MQLKWNYFEWNKSVGMCKTPLPAHCGLHFSKRDAQVEMSEERAWWAAGVKGGVAAESWLEVESFLLPNVFVAQFN